MSNGLALKPARTSSFVFLSSGHQSLKKEKRMIPKQIDKTDLKDMSLYLEDIVRGSHAMASTLRTMAKAKSLPKDLAPGITLMIAAAEHIHFAGLAIEEIIDDQN